MKTQWIAVNLIALLSAPEFEACRNHITGMSV